MTKRLPQNFSLYKYGLNVRFVKESDAKFILDLLYILPNVVSLLGLP